MSESGQLANARKNTLKDNDNQFDMYLYCGGGGAGYAPPPAGVPGIVLEYRVSKLIVRNMLLAFQNDLIGYGVQFYTDSVVTVETGAHRPKRNSRHSINTSSRLHHHKQI